MIYSVDDGKHFVISSHGYWLPGVYATRKAAQWAFQFSDEDLLALRDKVNGPITTDDLAERLIVTRTPAERGKADYRKEHHDRSAGANL